MKWETLRSFYSHPAFIAPEADVEAVGEAIAVLATNFREPWSGLIEFFASPAFWHQEDAFLGEGVGGRQGLNFR